MTRKVLAVFPLLLFCLCLCPFGAYAATVRPNTCSNSDVQNAVNSAANGDTVLVPAGNCTWSTPVSISKGITFQGAGIGQTNITDATSDAAVDVNGASASNFVTVTGFTFIMQSSKAGGMVQFGGTLFNVAFRLHHNRFLTANCCTRGVETGSVYGLIDHNTFDVTASSGSIQSISPGGSSIGNDGGFTPWQQPLSLGTNKAVYIEDNTFNYSAGAAAGDDSIDAYSGARLVVRHNNFNNSHIGFHGFDSGSMRSTFSVEVYNNTFTNNTNGNFRGGTMRGGTGVWHDNVYTGSHSTWDGITLMVYRACGLEQSQWGACDGTKWQLGSTDFKAQASRTSSTNGGVKFCSIARDTVCTSDSTCSAIGGGTCSTFLDGSGTGGNACRDQPGRTHDQVLSPVYAWNNGSMHIETYSGGNSCGPGLSNYLQAGRDYIDGSAMPGYTPYTYPHPLQSASNNNPPPTGPQPPSGLAAVVN